jgi:hypothetical protein
LVPPNTADDSANAPTRPEDTGAACVSASECYPGVADGELLGDALCLDEVRDGYCTHECENDDDCCAAEGECKINITQVCSPFQSTDMTMCFLSCEADDVDAFPDYADENEYCQREASRDFICRSSGGGADNRRICVPFDCGVGADCGDDADCTGDLECVTTFGGGYCTRQDCSENADCPTGSLCITHGNGNNYCYTECSRESDCSLCRPDGFFATCTDEVVFAEDGTSGTVCAPP